MTSAPSRLTVSRDGRAIMLSGDLDSHTAPVLEEALAELGDAEDITIGMDGVGFVDSSGLRVIIEAHGRHAKSASQLILVSPSSAVLRVVEITGLIDHLHIAN